MRLIVWNDYVDYRDAMSWFQDVSNSKNDKLSSRHEDFEKIFVFEHKDVYTAGKSIQNNLRKNENLEKKTLINGVPVVYTDRGGLWTWHGRGQVVVYFIYDLHSRNMRLYDFIAIVEEVVIKNVNFEIKRLTARKPIDIGLKLYADSEKRGFWVEKINIYDDIYGKKVAKFGFIGLKVSKGVVYHGISINYMNNLSFFNYINPCGLGDVEIISVKELLEKAELGNFFDTNFLDIKVFKLSLGRDLFKALNV